MLNFRFVGHFDTLPVMYHLSRMKPSEWPEGEQEILDDWKSMQSLIARMRRAVMTEHDKLVEAGAVRGAQLSGEMGRKAIYRLDPGKVTNWHSEEDGTTQRFHMPLVTNPSCVVHSAFESVHMEVGSLWWQNSKPPYCEANWGKNYRLHLIFEMLRYQDNKEP